MSKWISDDAGDLVNLDHIECITLAVVTEDQEAPEGHTHELLAITPDKESYRVFSGSETKCRAARGWINAQLDAYNPDATRS